MTNSLTREDKNTVKMDRFKRLASARQLSAATNTLHIPSLFSARCQRERTSHTETICKVKEKSSERKCATAWRFIPHQYLDELTAYTLHGKVAITCGAYLCDGDKISYRVIIIILCIILHIIIRLTISRRSNKFANSFSTDRRRDVI